ncbi:MAG: c-type cytochrome [Betaproteobacteria bacterium]|nr:c-type cytochrome [Betaproteobacteria bacterium]
MAGRICYDAGGFYLPLKGDSMKSFLSGLLGVLSLVTAGSIFAATADETYKSACGACHDAGLAGAPKLGDKAAWAPRVKQGKEALYKIALQGKPGTAMMPKGGVAKLSDAEVKAVVDLMLAKIK